MGRTETQRKILEAGKREFLEKGFKDASLNRIVAEAGFTKGAFYGYYPDKTLRFPPSTCMNLSLLCTIISTNSS